MSTGDLRGDLLAHLHANPRLRPAQLAAMLAAPLAEVERAIADLVAAGHLERAGDRLVPDAASHPTPGLFVPGERADAAPVEVDFSEDEDGEE